MYVCMHVCMCVCICVSELKNVCLYISVSAQPHIYMQRERERERETPDVDCRIFARLFSTAASAVSTASICDSAKLGFERGSA